MRKDMGRVMKLATPLTEGALLNTILRTVRESVEVTSKKFKLTDKYTLNDVQKLIANIRCSVDERLGRFTQVMLPELNDTSLNPTDIRFAEMQAEIHSVINNSSFQRIIRPTLDAAFGALNEPLAARFAKGKGNQLGFPKIVIEVINLHKVIMPGSSSNSNHPVISAIEEIPSIDEFCKVIYLPMCASIGDSLEDQLPSDLSSMLQQML